MKNRPNLLILMETGIGRRPRRRLRSTRDAGPHGPFLDTAFPERQAWVRLAAWVPQCRAAGRQASNRDGVRFVDFEAPADGRWAVLAAAGKGADFEAVNRY